MEPVVSPEMMAGAVEMVLYFFTLVAAAVSFLLTARA
jgi:hypothetical protein